MSKAVVGNTI